MKLSHKNSFSYDLQLWDELPLDQQELINLAKEACHLAYAPYSGFTVGAALLLDNGEIIKGANQENAAYPSGLCAERVAIFQAATRYPNANFEKMAVTALKTKQSTYLPVTPCGGCRQVMLEYERKQSTDFKIIFQINNKWATIPKCAYLLPFCFDKESIL